MAHGLTSEDWSVFLSRSPAQAFTDTSPVAAGCYGLRVQQLQ